MEPQVGAVRHRADWKSEIQPTKLIAYLSAKRRISKSGVSWVEMAAHDYFYCIADMIDTTAGYHLTAKVVREIINDPSISMTADGIMSEFKRRIYPMLNGGPQNSYSLYTRVDGVARLYFKDIESNSLIISKKIPENFVVDGSEFDKLAARERIPYKCKSNVGILVKGKSYHVNDFAENAIEGVNYVCGAFNLISASTTYVIIGDRNVSTAWMGSAPIFFLFEGEVRSDSFYRESRFSEVTKGGPQYEALVREYFARFHAAVCRAQRKLPYITLRSAIARLYLAKADPDVHNRLIKLWSLLEILTLAGSDHALVCRRVSHFFANGPELHVMGELARYFRNSQVHEGKEHNNIYIYTHYLSQMCAQFIRFYIDSAHKFSGETHVAKYLDTARSEEALAVLDRAIRTARHQIKDLEFSRGRIAKIRQGPPDQSRQGT